MHALLIILCRTSLADILSLLNNNACHKHLECLMHSFSTIVDYYDLQRENMLQHIFPFRMIPKNSILFLVEINITICYTLIFIINLAIVSL